MSLISLLPSSIKKCKCNKTLICLIREWWYEAGFCRISRMWFEWRNIIITICFVVIDTLTCSWSLQYKLHTFILNREFVKEKKHTEFTLTQYLNRQKFMLHGYEARTLKFIPKVSFLLTPITTVFLTSFMVLMVVIMKINSFWNVTPCDLVET